MKKVPDIIIETSRRLRKNMTEAEETLWNKLKAKKFKNIKFLRQSPIYVFTEDSGLERYVIPDFLCKEYNMIVEIDGSIHTLKDVYILDKQKEKLLKNQGYSIIRLDNKEILYNINQSLFKIAASFPC